MARKILLADDSVTAQNMGRKILADAGYDIVTVNNGSAALKKITEIKPDLVVLDVYMPGYSGLEVCQRLKESAETAHIPVLLTAGKLEPFKADEVRRVGADAHIVKPFEASELLAAITRLEARIAPQPAESAPAAGVEQEEAGPEAEADAAGAAFRDFRKEKTKPGANPVFTVEVPPPGQEPGQGSDAPREITPEKLDAPGALAAKLDGPVPAIVVGPVAAAAEVPAFRAEERPGFVSGYGFGDAEISSQSDAALGVAHAKADVAAASFSAEAPAFTVEAPAPAVEGEREGKSEGEITIEPVPLVTSVLEASALDVAEPAGPGPSDEELAAALRLLTPATAHAEVATLPSHGSLAAAGHPLAEEVVRDAAASPRWVAEPVPLSTEEAAISLEGEMSRAFAAAAAATLVEMPAAASGGELERAQIPTVEAIAAAVEDRLAESGVETAAVEQSSVEQFCVEQSSVEQSSVEQSSETGAKETLAANAPVEAIAVSATEGNRDASPGVEGREPMGDEKAKPGKSSWRQIRTAPTGAAAKSDVVEAAKQAEPVAEEPPKVMAAAAAESSASASVPDASIIASIVDSVMADLRPKIVEEIARKLAGK